MQHSATMAGRALVLIAFLIVIPLLALFGSSLPNMLVAVLDRWEQPRPKEPDRGLEEAPRFQPGDTPSADWAAPRVEAPLAMGQPFAGPAGPASSSMGGPPVVAVGGTLYPSAPPNGGTASRNEAVPTGYTAPVAPPSEGSLRRGLVPVAPPQRSSPGVASIAGQVPLQPEPSALAAGQDRLRQMLQRLDEVGATYCRLESWGTQQGLYRFHCRMPVAGGPNLTRQFEATDPDPIGAVGRVVSEVEAWRAGQEPVLQGGASGQNL